LSRPAEEEQETETVQSVMPVAVARKLREAALRDARSLSNLIAVEMEKWLDSRGEKR